MPHDMRIDLGSFAAAVAQQILNDARVGAHFHEVSGAGMAQHMQRNGALDTGPACGLLHYYLQYARCRTCRDASPQINVTRCNARNCSWSRSSNDPGSSGLRFRLARGFSQLINFQELLIAALLCKKGRRLIP